MWAFHWQEHKAYIQKYKRGLHRETKEIQSEATKVRRALITQSFFPVSSTNRSSAIATWACLRGEAGSSGVGWCLETSLHPTSHWTEKKHAALVFNWKGHNWHLLPGQMTWLAGIKLAPVSIGSDGNFTPPFRRNAMTHIEGSAVVA